MRVSASSMMRKFGASGLATSLGRRSSGTKQRARSDTFSGDDDPSDDADSKRSLKLKAEARPKAHRSRSLKPRLGRSDKLAEKSGRGLWRGERDCSGRSLRGIFG